MNPKYFSSKEFKKLREEINEEIKRRGTYSWWNPLVPPTVGQDRTSPLVTPPESPEMKITDRTYTINTPSSESIEETKNIHFPLIGDNPANGRNDSSSKLEIEEIKNLLVGLAKILNIDLYYGREEEPGLPFRDPNKIEEALKKAQSDILNEEKTTDNSDGAYEDPNGGLNKESDEFPIEGHVGRYKEENGKYVMEAGESNGEEGVPNEEFFFDDYKPFNTKPGEVVDRSWNEESSKKKVIEEIPPSSTYGMNPRNPEAGTSFRSRPVQQGVPGSCRLQCTGLCYTTCHSECSESCATTCHQRCGEACTANCGNICTGCTTLCMYTCKTCCRDRAGYSCIKAGVTPNSKGSHSCEDSCSYSCRFYPNRSATCTDAGCKQLCFNSCLYSCEATCSKSCIDNPSEHSSFTKGIGRGCRSECSADCVSTCFTVCVGECVHSCFGCCKTSCWDNCNIQCSTICGQGCAASCVNGEKGTCGKNNCTALCSKNCNTSCFSSSCRTQCGIDGTSSCSSCCRMSCTESSCTAVCENACYSQCSSCAFNCSHSCLDHCKGTCGGCCNYNCDNYCDMQCQLDCTSYCMHSCNNECSSCSNLCYSCVGKCIGQCSVRCSGQCSHCSNNCSFHCDTSCHKICMMTCDRSCKNHCSNQCSNIADSTSIMHNIKPTNPTYHTPNPSNTKEEIEALKIIKR